MRLRRQRADRRVVEVGRKPGPVAPHAGVLNARLQEGPGTPAQTLGQRVIARPKRQQAVTRDERRRLHGAGTGEVMARVAPGRPGSVRRHGVVEEPQTPRDRLANRLPRTRPRPVPDPRRRGAAHHRHSTGNRRSPRNVNARNRSATPPSANRISGKRRVNSCRTIFISSRESGAPRQKCGPWPNER